MGGGRSVPEKVALGKANPPTAPSDTAAVETSQYGAFYKAKSSGSRASILPQGGGEEAAIVVKNRDSAGSEGNFGRCAGKALNLLQTSALEPRMTIIEQHPSKGCQ